MSRQLLHGDDIDPSVQQIPHEGAPEIMRRAVEYSGLHGPLLQNEIDRLVGHASLLNAAIFEDGAKKRS